MVETMIRFKQVEGLEAALTHGFTRRLSETKIPKTTLLLGMHVALKVAQDFSVIRGCLGLVYSKLLYP